MPFLTFFLLFSCSVFAQSGSVVVGRILDGTTRAGIPGARVEVREHDSSFVVGAISKKNGSFSFRLSAGTFRLHVSSLGYSPIFQNFTVKQGDTVRLGDFLLQPSAVEMSEVVVSVIAPRMEIRGDTVEFNADMFKTAKNASAEDLVKKLPGVEVDANGTVKAQGEQVRSILVDGKPFFGDDPALVLKNLPAEIIDRVQTLNVMSEQSQFSRFDDGNRVKTLNIITKKGLNNGQFGKLYAGYGTNERFTAGGNENFFSGERRLSFIGLTNNLQSSSEGKTGNNHSLNVNYSDKWSNFLAVSGSYSVNYGKNESDQTILRQYIVDTGATQSSNQNSINSTQNLSNRVNFRVEITFDSLNSLLFTPHGSFSSNDALRSSLSSTMSAQEIELNSTDLHSSSSARLMNIGSEILFRHRFETNGRTFSADIRLDKNTTQSEENNHSFMSYADTSGFSKDSLLQKIPTDDARAEMSANCSYTEPINDNSSLQIKYTLSRKNSESDRLIYNADVLNENYNQINTSLSNSSHIVSLAHRPSVAYSLNFGNIGTNGKPNSHLMLGVDYSATQFGVDQEYPQQFSINRMFTAILPAFSFTTNFSSTGIFGIGYRNSTSQPSPKQLQNLIDNSDPLRISFGNPQLKQEYSQTMNVNFSLSDSLHVSTFVTNISATHTADIITNSTFTATHDTIIDGQKLGSGAQLLRSINMDGYWNAHSSAMYSFPFEPISEVKLHLNFTLGGNYTRSVELINNLPNIAGNFSLAPSFGVSSNISEHVDFSILARISFNTIHNSAQQTLGQSFYSHNLTARWNYGFWDTYFMFGDWNYTKNSNVSGISVPASVLLNGGFGGRIFDGKGEIKLSVFDIFNVGASSGRNVIGGTVEDIQTKAQSRYFLFNFTYFLRNF